MEELIEGGTGLDALYCIVFNAVLGGIKVIKSQMFPQPMVDVDLFVGCSDVKGGFKHEQGGMKTVCCRVVGGWWMVSDKADEP